MKKLALLLIKLYRYGISPMMGRHCRFYPSCSSYAYQAIERFGLIKGGYLAALRLARCHPWHAGGFDPVPDKNPDSSSAQPDTASNQSKSSNCKTWICKERS